jgi:hypothetical protein
MFSYAGNDFRIGALETFACKAASGALARVG